MLGALLGSAASAAAAITPWAPAPTNKAATLFTVDPETEWAPISRGITFPIGNSYDATADSLVFSCGNFNPGLYGSTSGFLMFMVDWPYEAYDGNERPYLFGVGTFWLRLYGANSTDPNAVIYGWSGTGMTPSTGTHKAYRDPAKDRMLIALVRDPVGGTLSIKIISADDGAVIANTSTSLTGTRSNSLTGVVLGGLDTAATSTERFQGAIEFAISGRGVTPSTSDLQAIALGANPHTILSGLGTPSYELYADLRGLCTTLPATIGPPSGITSTSAGLVAFGNDVFAGDTIRRQSTTQYLVPRIDWRWGQVHGITPAQATRSVTVTVHASSGVAPEFRAATRAGKGVQNWTPMSSAGSGVFTGTLTTGWYDDWGVLEFRDSLNTSNLNTRALMTKPHAIGPKIVAIGQSQIANNGFATTARGDTLAAQYRGKVAFYDRSGERGIVVPGFSNASDGLKWFVKQWVDGGGGPAVIVNNTVGATGALATLADGYIARPIATEQAFAADTGTEGATIVWQWVTADLAEMSTDGGDYYEAVLFGTPAAISAQGYSSALLTSHYIARDTPGGLWGADAYFVLSPPTRHQSSNSTVSYSTQGSGYSTARKSAVDWTVAEGFVTGPYIDDIFLKDQFHPDDTNLKGNPLIGSRLAQAALRAFGLYPDADPAITSITLTAPNIYTVTISLPNGGTLYCPAPSAVTGFEVNGSGDPALFTASVVGNKVRLTKASGNWTGSETITYGAGYPRSYVSLTGQQAMVDGTLYESYAGDVMGLGVPVAPYGI